MPPSFTNSVTVCVPYIYLFFNFEVTSANRTFFIIITSVILANYNNNNNITIKINT